MISLKSSGDFEKTRDSIRKLLRREFVSTFDKYGQLGVDALSRATPVDTGLTASSWGYRVIKGNRPGIEWYNTNVVNGTPVAILIQYGHGTGTGGYVVGFDYINPAIRPIFEAMVTDIWKEVTL